ncbi:hypothetical protein PDR5_06110 [Pseudomonas sp. DR 5-09]|nr:hypothetical protein PDR5_06110 [Pseudomonas sp. DR 5-09]
MGHHGQQEQEGQDDAVKGSGHGWCFLCCGGRWSGVRLRNPALTLALSRRERGLTELSVHQAST